MSALCRNEPVSFLRLERYLLGELAEHERVRVHAHLGECAACRSCFDELIATEVQLPSLLPTTVDRLASPLPDIVPIDRSRAVRHVAFARWSVGGATLALAAAMFLMLHVGEDRVVLPSATTRIKGGELALVLVRERDGDIARDPTVFDARDRIEASVSCPPSAAPAYWDFVVLQAGRAFFPLRNAAPISCANDVALPGAFRLTGKDSATVCIVLSDRVLDRHQLSRGAAAFPKSTACLTLSPAAL
jgi:hypothetical protein